MIQRLYLVGYDISEPKRQAIMRYNIRNHSATGQRSAYECLLSTDTKQQLTELAKDKTESNDAFFMIRTINTYWSQVTKGNPSKRETLDTGHFYIG